MSLLRVENLHVHFRQPSDAFLSQSADRVRAIDDLSLEVKEGQIVGIAGETGCGKSTLARVLLKLQRPTSGLIFFNGRPLHKMSGHRFRPLRGDVQLISSHPTASFRPGWSIRHLFLEVLHLHHRELNSREKRDRILYLLQFIGLDEDCASRSPLDLNLFDQQRLCLGRVLATQPRFVVCDDLTLYLDTVSQARILDLLKDIRVHWRVTLLFMSRDYAAVSQMSDVLHIMNRGRFVESGSPDHLFHHAQHEYTRQLLALSGAV